MIPIAFSPIYKYELPEGHRFPMDKYELLPEQLLYEGTISESWFFEPKALKDSDILLTHTSEYLHKLNHNQLSYKEARKIGFPVQDSLIKRGKYIAQGTYDCAVKAISSNSIALNIAGGTHHAYADSGGGFCVFNDIAIASNLLIKHQLAEKIMIVDLDVHQGNGNAKIFENNKAIFTFSMHGAKNYPAKKEKSNLDIGMADGTEDKEYLSTLYSTLPRIIDNFQPDFIFYLSGVDIIKSDKLGRLAVSKNGCKQRDEFVFELCKKNQIPVAVSMGGGYSPNIRDIIDAHANTFRCAVDIFD